MTGLLSKVYGLFSGHALIYLTPEYTILESKYNYVNPKGR